MLTQVVILSFLASTAFASSNGPRRINYDGSHKHARNETASRTIHRRTAGVPITPSDWPTTTQAAATPSITVANSADPYLNGLSDALNNNANSLWTTKYTGDLTYYDTGSVSCGDVYDDTTYTAAVSHLMYDAWPGVTANTNRNPICGPWVPGRQILSSTGAWETVVSSTDGTMQIGGDGLPNCLAGSKCHIPMTATVTNPATGLSVVVSIVDRCTGCAMGDIDLTPTAFSAIADTNLGRVSGIEWSFNVMGGSAPPGTTTTTTTTKATTSTSSSTTTKLSTTTTTSTTHTTTSTTSNAATTTTSATSSGNCAGIAAWSSALAYTGGQQVTYGGYLWTAAYWTEDSVPGGAAGVWIQGAAC